MSFTTRQIGSSRARKRSVLSEINVTPMIDVMLVLLVIFMITAPLLTVGVKVDLPKSQAKIINEQDEPLVISIKNNKSLYIGNTEVDSSTFVDKLIAITNANLEVRIYLYADRSLMYEDVMKVIGALNQAGFKKVALISEQYDPPRKSKSR